MSKTISFDFSDLGVGREKKAERWYRLLGKHFDLRLDDQPDFLLHSHGGQRHRLHPGIRIFWTSESYPPDYTGSDFSLTHHHDSETNLRVPVYSLWTDPEKIIKTPGEAGQIIAENRDFCCFFTSYISPKIQQRIDFFHKLSAYRPVASAGKAMNTIGRSIPYGLDAKIAYMRGFKFYMAFENESMPGYTTEKIVEAMLARCIPIYFGNPEIAEEFNPESLINFHDFPSMEALVAHIREVDQNEELYHRYLNAPYFHHNVPNRYFSEERIVGFFNRVFSTEPPVSKRRRPRFLGRWIIAKQDIAPKLEISSGERPRVSIDYADFGRNRSKEAIFLHQVLSKHFDLRLCDNPDFLIYSHDGDSHRLHSGTRIYWTCEDYAPDWSVMDYALTCRYDEDPRHLRLPFYTSWIPAQSLVKQDDEWKTLLAEKIKFCAFFTSYRNRKTAHRFRFFEKLSQYRKVDSGGRAANNIGGPIPFEMGAKLDFLKPYKFYIAFENKVTPGYVTEKIAEAMASRCIPIYFGCPRVVEEFNPRSFLSYHDFPSEEALIQRIREIDQNDELYAEYLREPYFLNNTPNLYYSEERLVAFFRRIFTSERKPLALRKRHPVFGRWKLVRYHRSR